jgi:hypothetical protein
MECKESLQGRITDNSCKGISKVVRFTASTGEALNQ